ncbi:hypothetical protein EI983_06055 [Roseovarius faecimaris]|uniref:Uncharacterized protein n=1 Tax=Roseovarius faecimaris TaxID=2494550 RepID=A0A6I6ILC9_9RHOB|nr:hypothetical protein [Roseovarius faecimaris]QGX97860.1 hypothetical protein EI983_06055 [Roseovarius faecimaris]
MARHIRPDSQSFQRFYYTKVGLGEGCGCAERVIDVYEADRKAGEAVHGTVGPRLGLAQRARRLLNALGLFRRA